MSRIYQAIVKAKAIGNKIRSGDQPTDEFSRHRMILETEKQKLGGIKLEHICKLVLPAPVEVLEENRIVAALPSHKMNGIDDYKMLRTKTLRRLSANKWRSLAITSAKQGEGKTLTALNLGISISMDRNYEVILVDTDLRSPSVHERLGIEPKKGLSDYLAGEATLSEILVSPGIEGFAVIPNFIAIENSAEVLMGSRMRDLLDELRKLSPSVILIFDLPPLSVDDALAFGPLIDSLMLVFRAGQTYRDDVVAAREATAEMSVIGCVVNSSQVGGGSTYY